MIRAIPVLIGLALSTAALAQQPPAPASAPVVATPPKAAAQQRDLTDPRMRDMPVRCRPGQVQHTTGRTLGEVFGADWPAAPDVPAARRTPAQTVTLGRVQWPAGVAGTQASAVSAVLVDAQGRPLRVEVLCASAHGLEPAVKQASMQGTYRAATFDGKPATSVVVVGWRMAPPRAER